MQYLPAIIFFAVVIGGLVVLKLQKEKKSLPVKGGGGTIPEGQGTGDGSVTPPTGPAAE